MLTGLSRAPLPRKQAPGDSFKAFVTDTIKVTSKPEQITDHRSVFQLATQGEVFSQIIPDKRTAVEENLTHYWTFRWELAYINGVLYKGDIIIISIGMRPRMLNKSMQCTNGRKINSQRHRNVLANNAK